LHAKLINLAKELRDNVLANFLIPMLEYLLNSVISIWILGQFDSELHQFLNHFNSVFLFVCLGNNYLDYTETTVVGGQLNELVCDLIENELSLGLIKHLDQVLDHMGTLNILEDNYIKKVNLTKDSSATCPASTLWKNFSSYSKFTRSINF
jgi:hypothetical protein